MHTEIYLDGNATGPVLPAAVAAAAQVMAQDFGNPSSTHLSGLRARALLDGVRRRAARLIGAADGRLMFNSGATEGIHTAVLSALTGLRERRAAGASTGRWLLYGATEHKAVPEALAHWNRLLGLDLEIRPLPVGPDGRHDLHALRALASDTALLCTMAANNETGVVSDLAGIEAVLAASASPALWLVDCVQALGKLPLDLAATRIDYAPFSGHKLYAPKGIGMLWVRRGAPFTPLMTGGGQEDDQRAGTENMAAIAALGAVLAALEDGGTFHAAATLAAFRDRLAASLQRAFDGLQFNAPLPQTLPTTLNFSVPGLSSGELMNLFDAAGLRVSAGSACSAARAAPSHVLQAMQRSDECCRSALRLSFGPAVEAATIDAACAAIERCGEALRRTREAAAAGARAAADGPVGDAGAAALLPAAPPCPALQADPSHALEPAALADFLRRHPGACLVDVREAHEHAAGGGLVLHGRRALNVPLAGLPAMAREWLRGARVPLVFVCRSGPRSAQACAWVTGQGGQGGQSGHDGLDGLDGLGGAPVRYLVGGLAQLPRAESPASVTA